MAVCSPTAGTLGVCNLARPRSVTRFFDGVAENYGICALTTVTFGFGNKKIVFGN